MNLDFNSLTQEEKYRAYACIAAIVSYFLPWWSFSGQYNILGQSSSVSTNINGFDMKNFIIGIGAAGAALYFIFTGMKYSLWAALVCVLYAANIYFKWTGGSSMNFSFNTGSVGSARMGGDYSFGFYLFAVASALLLYLELKESGFTINAGGAATAETPSIDEPEPPKSEPKED
jgi:hypothetical protein